MEETLQTIGIDTKRLNSNQFIIELKLKVS